MILLADESVEKQIVEQLRNDGHNVEYISEMSPGVSDNIVLQTAAEKKALLITSDKDFGELFFRLDKLHFGVLLLRLEGVNINEKKKVVSLAINKYGERISGRISVLNSKAIRIR